MDIERRPRRQIDQVRLVRHGQLREKSHPDAAVVRKGRDFTVRVRPTQGLLQVEKGLAASHFLQRENIGRQAVDHGRQETELDLVLLLFRLGG